MCDAVEDLASAAVGRTRGRQIAAHPELADDNEIWRITSESPAPKGAPTCR